MAKSVLFWAFSRHLESLWKAGQYGQWLCGPWQVPWVPSGFSATLLGLRFPFLSQTTPLPFIPSLKDQVCFLRFQFCLPWIHFLAGVLESFISKLLQVLFSFHWPLKNNYELNIPWGSQAILWFTLFSQGCAESILLAKDLTLTSECFSVACFEHFKRTLSSVNLRIHKRNWLFDQAHMNLQNH